MGRNPSVLVEEDTVTLVMSKDDLRPFMGIEDERLCLVINKRQFQHWLEETAEFIE